MKLKKSLAQGEPLPKIYKFQYLLFFYENKTAKSHQSGRSCALIFEKRLNFDFFRIFFSCQICDSNLDAKLTDAIRLAPQELFVESYFT